VTRLCLVLAGWLAFVRQMQVSGQRLHDPLARTIAGIIAATPDGDGYVRAMLGLEGVFTHAIASHDTVITEMTSWYRRIDADGIAACLEEAALVGDSSNRSAQQ
jgi:mannitol-1-phosphate/altronate dehydrogenase